MREKLIELLKKAKAKEQHDFLFGDIDTAIDMPYGAEYYADHLIANGVTIQEWISVKDRLPEEDIRVLVWVGENDRYFPIIMESDYVQEKMDAKPRGIFGEIDPFKVRYPYMKDWNYKKPMKGK